MPKFSEIGSEQPVVEEVAKRYERIRALVESGEESSSVEGVSEWESLRRDLGTWSSLVHLRFNQDTANEEYKRARDYCDTIAPKLTELSIGVMRLLVNSSARAALEKRFGRQCFAIWENDILTYDPAIERDLVEEARLKARYTELLAAAKIPLRGREYNLSEIVKFREQPDRALREEAEKARWGWFASERGSLDSIYGDLVGLRASMANKLGYDSFIPLAYRNMCRIGYGREQVERFREEVRREVVPLARELKDGQRRRLGVERMMFWDEGIQDPRGNPAPGGGHDWLLERATEMFDSMGPELGGFFRLLRSDGYLDLPSRDGKAGGGFCTSFPSHGMPFIFANFNGTKGDVEVFTHEVGHAFQCYMSRELPLSEYLWPTTEACEIHSMSLEFLTYPYMDKFFGSEAERFREIHLEQAILFLPYGVAVDHFQHLVYLEPEASPARRFEMWREMEELYLPWRDYGDLSHCPDGGFWQSQRHIYLNPFYYIDYALAQTCALQFWLRASKDRNEAMSSYVEICRRGGEAPFGELCKGAGLRSPFEEGSLGAVVAEARARLGRA